MATYAPPEYKKDGFNCPFCGAFAHQQWAEAMFSHSGSPYSTVPMLEFATCSRCERFAIWYGKKMIYPFTGTGPSPNPDLPKDVIADYDEARSISSLSPRGSAALLRLAIQKLVIFLGEKGDNLNADIGKLVKKGLHVKIQQSLDFVRVIGDQAVHPGQIDLKDDHKTVAELFGLVNLIGETMITQPKHVNELFERLPETKKDAIRIRDTKEPTK